MFHHIDNAADAEPLRRHMHAALKAHAASSFRLARIHPLVQRTPLRGEIVFRPRLLVVNQRALARAEASVGCLKMPAQTVGCAPLGAHALFVLNACLKDDFCFEEKRFVCFRQALRAGNAFAPEGKYSMITGYGLLDVN